MHETKEEVPCSAGTQDIYSIGSELSHLEDFVFSAKIVNWKRLLFFQTSDNTPSYPTAFDHFEKKESAELSSFFPQRERQGAVATRNSSLSENNPPPVQNVATNVSDKIVVVFNINFSLVVANFCIHHVLTIKKLYQQCKTKSRSSCEIEHWICCLNRECCLLDEFIVGCFRSW